MKNDKKNRSQHEREWQLQEAKNRLSPFFFPRNGCEMFGTSCSIAREQAKLNGMAMVNTGFDQG